MWVCVVGVVTGVCRIIPTVGAAKKVTLSWPAPPPSLASRCPVCAKLAALPTPRPVCSGPAVAELEAQAVQEADQGAAHGRPRDEPRLAYHSSYHCRGLCSDTL